MVKEVLCTPIASNSSIASCQSSILPVIRSYNYTPDSSYKKKRINKSNEATSQLKCKALVVINEINRILSETPASTVNMDSSCYCKHSLHHELLRILSNLIDQEETIQMFAKNNNQNIFFRDIISQLSANRQKVEIIFKIIHEIGQEEQLIEDSITLIENRIDESPYQKTIESIKSIEMSIGNVKSLVDSVERIRQNVPLYLPCSSTTCVAVLNRDEEYRLTWDTKMRRRVKRLCDRLDRLRDDSAMSKRNPLGSILLLFSVMFILFVLLTAVTIFYLPIDNNRIKNICCGQRRHLFYTGLDLINFKQSSKSIL